MSHLENPRERFPWFPTINYDLCLSDLDCVNFCPYDVYEWHAETGRPIVTHPYNCLPGCDACAQMCRTGAISLPSREEVRAALRRIRAEVESSGSQ